VKPDVDRLLEVAAVELIGKVSPALPTRYEQSNASVLGALLLATREELERGAARRIEENAALRGLLVELHAHVEALDTPAARRLDEAIWSELVVSTERRKLSLSFF
jgi:hypothetical protein